MWKIQFTGMQFWCFIHFPRLMHPIISSFGNFWIIHFRRLMHLIITSLSHAFLRVKMSQELQLFKCHKYREVQQNSDFSTSFLYHVNGFLILTMYNFLTKINRKSMLWSDIRFSFISQKILRFIQAIGDMMIWYHLDLFYSF